ncbi:MAG TPA: hypothetical protein VK536_08850 [Candidatus Limnocylindrales bacterium]|nr:hypothetical protein [Candidatus Limnocylindrales bacterium]
MNPLHVNQNVKIVLLSLLIQVPLGIFLGHAYDEKIFMTTGYLAASGLNPYQPHTIVNIFPSTLFAGVIPSIGYPPPWPLLLGFIYRISYNLVPNIFLYNFAIKVPVILGNICLAYLVKDVILKLNGDKNKARFAWLFILFNPFVLLTTVAWGEFDSIVALFCIASFYLLVKGRTNESAFSLALAVALKPIALPLVGLPFLFPSNNSKRKIFMYLVVFCSSFCVFYFLPFFLEKWSLPWGANELGAQFQSAGGLTPFNLEEIFLDSTALPGTFQLLGYLWVPALIVGYYSVYRNRPGSASELFSKAVGLTLIFFLTRTWLSEPNINIVLPLMLIAATSKELNFRSFHFAWIIPFVFLFLNTSFPQLFFFVYPSVLTVIAQVDQQIRSARLWARFAVVIPWQILSWNVVIKKLRGNPRKLSYR